jgi:uncharacterized membrane protein
MYTKARIASHPIHPMLVAFPIAFYVATVVALIVHAASGDPFWYRAAFWANLAGIAMAVIAAVPGAVDLFTTVPRATKARATGIGHATLNLTALVLFVLSVLIIGHGLYGIERAMPDAAPLALSLLGVGATVAAGIFGWTLVQKHHVGVTPTETHTIPPEQVDDLDELAAIAHRPLPRHQITLH